MPHSDLAASAQADADARARETEAQMTDDERFSLLVSVMGANDVHPGARPAHPGGTSR